MILAGLAIFGAIAIGGRCVGRLRGAGAFRRAADPTPISHWRPVALIAAGIVLNLLLAETGGFIVASAALFWFVARAFDAGHPLRDALFAVGVSVAAFLLFGRVLDLQLPAGVLAGVL